MQRRTSLLALLLILAMVLAACPAPAQPAAAPAAQPAVQAPSKEGAETEAPSKEGAESGGLKTELGEMAGKVVIAPGQNIRIGGSFALTGPIPDPGKDIRQAAEIAIDDLNAAGGVEGFKFELVAEDGACAGDQGTVVGNKFAADPTIVAVTGGTCSGETIGLMPSLQEARIPFVSPSATNPAITSADCDVCNRVALSDALQGVVDGDFVFNDLGKTKVAVIHDSEDYGKGLAEIFQDRFKELGGEVTNFEGIQVGDTDFRAALAKIGANAPELIYFGGFSTEAALIAQQMGETPGLDGAIFMSDDGAYTKQYLDAAGDAAEGTYMSFVAGATNDATLKEFNAKYMDKFGVNPKDLGPFHGQSYDSVMLIATAIKAVAVKNGDNLVIDREELIKAIRNVKGLQGLTGVLSCSEIGECGAGGVQIFTVSGGDFSQVAGFGME